MGLALTTITVSWAFIAAGVRGTEVLRYCHLDLKGAVLTFYETEAMTHPRSSIIMGRVLGISAFRLYIVTTNTCSVA